MDSPADESLLRHRLRFWGPPILWMGLIFYLSAQPQLPTLDETWLDFLLKKAGHIVVYAVLAWLLVRALVQEGPVQPRHLRLALLLTILYALSDELHQSFVPGRTARLLDVGFDTLGALLALARFRRL